MQCDKYLCSILKVEDMCSFLGPPETPVIHDNAGVLFGGSQASQHHAATKQIDSCCPGVKIRSELLLILL